MNRRRFLHTSASATMASILPLAGLAQQTTGAENATAPKKPQARAPKTQPFGAEAFGPSKGTTLRWLGGAGFMVNSRGTTLMVDPLLEGFDMKVMIEEPILPVQVPHLDGVLITHSDTDHYSVKTCQDLQAVCKRFDSTQYVSTVLMADHLLGKGHDIGEAFQIGNVNIKLLPVDHDWQNSFPQMHLRHFEKRDACGFWLETPDGTVWASGDSRLIPEQLTMPQMDAILFDFSEDAQFHSGLEGAVRIANAYPRTSMILGHWGTVDAPDFAPFNGDPQHLIAKVVNPDRIKVLAPGEPFRLQRL